MATCNMALKLILFLMISTYLNLPRAAEAMPPETMENQISVNILGNEVHGNNHVIVNEGNQGLVEKQNIQINQNISKILGNNLISVNENIGSNIESGATFQVTATQSEGATFQVTAPQSEDKTLEITAIPSEDKTLEITAIPSEDKTFQITAIPSDAPTQVIAETTAVPTTEPPATTPPIAETTVLSTTELPECPGDMFLFGPSNGRQCFKYYGDSKRTWTAADQKCRDENLVLAEPKEPTSLRTYIVANYNPNDWTYLGARGDGSSQRWVRSGAALSNTSPLWLPGAPGSRVTTADNLMLATTQRDLDNYPTTPYHARLGTTTYYTLCELVMN